MKKSTIYILLAVCLLGGVVFAVREMRQIRGKQEQVVENRMASPVASAIPVSEIDLEDTEAVSEAVANELDQLDREIDGLQGAELEPSGLSDEELGL